MCTSRRKYTDIFGLYANSGKQIHAQMPEFCINLNPIWDFYFNWNQELRKKMFPLIH